MSDLTTISRGGQPVAGGAFPVPRRRRRGYRPRRQKPHLWGGRRGCRQAAGPDKDRPEETFGVPAHRQAAASPRFSGKGEWHGKVRYQCPSSRHGDRCHLPLPVFGGKVKSFTADKARKVPGVTDMVAVPSGVAVIASGFWPARKGRELLEIIWDEGDGARLATPLLRKEYQALAARPGTVARQEGTPAMVAEAPRRIEAEYEVPFLAHAPMEPLNCFVDLKPDRCLIKVGTQFQTIDRLAAAAVAGLKPEQVEIETAYLGGGFGRRANPASDFVGEAVVVAKLVKKPVKVIWTRSDDLKGGYYRPLWLDRIGAGFDAAGKLISWRHTIVGQSIAVGTPFENDMTKDGVDAASVEGAAGATSGPCPAWICGTCRDGSIVRTNIVMVRMIKPCTPYEKISWTGYSFAHGITKTLV